VFLDRWYWNEKKEIKDRGKGLSRFPPLFECRFLPEREDVLSVNCARHMV
jgi:hypothetical protein